MSSQRIGERLFCLALTKTYAMSTTPSLSSYVCKRPPKVNVILRPPKDLAVFSSLIETNAINQGDCMPCAAALNPNLNHAISAVSIPFG
jgi:hypothetical protein